MNRSETHKRFLVRLMLEKGEVTASQIPFSNANQYFCELGKEGICKSRWGLKGKARVKFRFIPKNMIEKALRYIGIASTDNVQGLR